MSLTPSKQKLQTGRASREALAPLLPFTGSYSGETVPPGRVQEVLNVSQVAEQRSMTSVHNSQIGSEFDLVRLLDNRQHSKFLHESSEESGEDTQEFEETSSAEEEGTDEEDEEEDEEQGEEEESSSASAHHKEYEYGSDLERKEQIERYLTLYNDYKYLQKKNYFLQDRLYKLSVRKGIIIEEKKKVALKKRRRSKTSISSRKSSPASGDEMQWESPSGSRKPSRKSRSRASFPAKNSVLSEGAREAELLMKYDNSVRRIWQMQHLKEDIAEGKSGRHIVLDAKKDEAERECLMYFHEMMNQIRTVSKEAVNSYTGNRILPSETEAYIQEIEKMFHKLRYTVTKFYSNWHGLNYEVKRLEESQIESQGEGFQAIEYEQLCGENTTLKDKLEYRQNELHKAKLKVSNSIHVLAHFREKEITVMQDMITRQTTLDNLKTRIMKLSEIMDVVTGRYTILREEQKDLEHKSELIDNVTLMKDFKKTTQEVITLRGECSKLKDQARYKSLQLKNIEEKVKSITNHVSDLPLQSTNGSKSRNTCHIDNAKASQQPIQPPSRTQLAKEIKKLRLLELLELRHIEPWHHTREQLMSEMSTPCFASHKVTTIPV